MEYDDQIRLGQRFFDDAAPRMAAGYHMEVGEIEWAPRSTMDGSPPDPWPVRIHLYNSTIVVKVPVDLLVDAPADAGAQANLERILRHQFASFKAAH